MSGIYVHIPFCTSKCGYCAFNSRPVRGGAHAVRGGAHASRQTPVPAEYIDALLLDIARESTAWRGQTFESVYFGGGTPSLLKPGQLADLLDALRKRFKIKEHAEVTVECNPGTLNLERARAFRDSGVNRLSIGVQSMCDRELGALGRGHTAADCLRALDAACSAEIPKVSADVMLGIPGQSAASLGATIEQVSARVDHVSAYLLSVEPGTAFERLANLGELDLPSEGETIGLYEAADTWLRLRGFRRYEISNWGRPGHESVHNLMYWRRGEYTGIGAGAHSHRAGLRYSKVEDPVEYVKRLRGGADPVDMLERLAPGQVLLEEVMLGLRTDTGLDLESLTARREIDGRGLEAVVADLLAEGLLSRTGNLLQLSPNGIKVCDSVTESIAASAVPA